MKTKIPLIIFTVLAFSCSARKEVEPAKSTLDPNPMLKVKASSGNDTHSLKQWSIEKTQLDLAWKMTTGSNLVKIAVIGTGIDYNHEDLKANILVNHGEYDLNHDFNEQVDNKDNDGNGYIDDFIGWDVIDNDGLAHDKLGMGTASAGILAASHDNGKGIKGVLNKASLVPIRYIDQDGLTNTIYMVKALQYALVRKVDIILLHMANISFGLKPDLNQEAEKAALSAIFSKLAANNIDVVISAGNSSQNLSSSKSVLRFLATFNNVTIVTGVNQQDRKLIVANFGPEIVDTTAPAQKLITTFPNNQYQDVQGSLYAAAQVAGAYGLAKSLYGNRVRSQLLKRVLFSDKGSDYLESLELIVRGSNRLNVAKFLSELGNHIH